MPAILFVCTANQFRSPIAEAYFVSKLSSLGNTDSWTVSSAGTWTPLNLPAHPKAVEAAVKLGLDLGAHRTREVTADLAMERGHKEALESEFPQIHGKVMVLGNTGNDSEVGIPDPARDNFSRSFEIAGMICKSIDKFFSRIIRLAETLERGQRT
jgi:protein-tyrosine phosphatase